MCRLCIFRQDSRATLQRLQGWISIRSARLSISGETWLRAIPGSDLSLVCTICRTMDQTHPGLPCELMRRALEAATKAGDLIAAVYSFDNLNTNFLAAGDPLLEAQRQAENGLELAERAQFGHVIATQLGLIRTLRGLTYKFGCLDDRQFNEVALERHFAANPALKEPECQYWIRKLQARFFAGDYPSALDAAAR